MLNRKIYAFLLPLTLWLSCTLADGVVDAVTITNVKVVGDAPAMAMGNIYEQMQSELPSEYTGACHTAATAQCMAVMQENKVLRADETGSILVSLPDEYAGVTCSMTGCDGVNPRGVKVNAIGE
jgi:hypothetical protein